MFFGKAIRITMALLLITVIGVVAQETARTTFHAQEPVLITSAGQSADVLMVKILAQKAGLQFIYDKTAAPSMVDSVKSIIIVSGGSSKGLGAAKINKEQEYQRVQEIIKRAHQLKLPIIAIHVGGKSRRGKLSDYFNQLTASEADYIVVVKAGNADGFFTKIAQQKHVPIEEPEKIVGVQAVLQQIFQKGTP